jgi:holliday junction DNA helicase RuvA
MIEYISGKLVEKNPTYCVIDCNGLGYLIQISLQTFSKLPDNENCKLHIYYHVSVDVRSGVSAHNLYGFYTTLERHVFKQLISVSGVSSTIARMVLSSLSVDELQSAIIHNDSRIITKVKGIGPKLAERIVAELKSKISTDIPSENISNNSYNTIRQEALSALLALGFDRTNSAKILDKLLKEQQNMTVEELIKLALKQL